MDKDFLNRIVDGYMQFIKDLPDKSYYNFYHGSYTSKWRFDKYLIGLNLPFVDYKNIKEQLGEDVDDYVRTKLPKPKKVAKKTVIVEETDSE